MDTLKNTVTSEQVTIAKAQNYEKKRFTRSYRMRRLDRLEKAFASDIFEMLGNDVHIVDIPCGDGRFFDIFSNVKKLTMIDYSENMLTVVKEKFGNAKNVAFVRADITNLPLPFDSAELCFCMRLFHHMKNDEVRLDALRELARVSKKYVALSFYNKSCPRYYWRKLLGKKIRGNYVTFTHIVGLARQAGLKCVKRIPRVNTIEQQCLIIFENV